ncbi:prolyl oligopeptidase family serine peptidase [Pseudoalteromonas sp. OANN1]|uniref:S9 family peptidase n=1 Tax=Pseudoalteromonas sp. OANN1 TaxID=2954497 RepID=UPI002097E671|nr:prolyl oligopeptidase family serine peptidase [Pseudoalteromonas sp. OANN1]MCO7199109.1 prolyl oligopeptidase family serine peptidase [Pseudoalteromonas sp. OANN1]
MTLKLSLLSAALFSVSSLAAKPSLEFKDVFDFRYPQGTVISEQGTFLGLSAKPYRGDSEGQVYSLNNKALIASVPRGTNPVINKSGQWVGFTQRPTLLEKETADKKKKKTLKNNLVLVNTTTKAQQTFNSVKDYQLSDNGQWLVYREDAKKGDNKSDAKANTDKQTDELKISADKGDDSLTLVVLNLSNNESTRYDDIAAYKVAPSSNAILVNQQSEDGSKNRVAVIDLASNQITSLIDEPGVTLGDIAWQPNSQHVAFYLGNYVNDDKRRRDYQLKLWSPTSNKITDIHNPSGWFSGKTASIKWSEDGSRLFFENRPQLEAKAKVLKYTDESSLYDYDTIRQQKGLKVWHNADPEIKTREIKTWNESRRDQHYQAVYHINGEHVVQLENLQVPSISLHTNANFVLGSDDTPYLKQIMYKGFYRDYYSVDISSGDKQLIVKESSNRPTVAPDGKHAAYFDGEQVWLKSLSTQQLTPVSKAVKNALFADDKHDKPEPNEGFGFAGWQLDGSTLYAYSKYDIWAFDTKTAKATRLTDGYKTQTQYRIEYKDKDKLGFNPDDTLLLSAHNLENKQTHIATLSLQDNKLQTVLSGEAKYGVVKKAKEVDTYIFTRQSYQEFPDYWVSDGSFNNPTKLTDLNPQQQTFAWGQKPELVKYKGYDGEDLQGVLIKPADYKAGDKVPVVIYFYRYMSQRMYDFPKMELNHRPNLPMYTSNGYAIFLPDIRFEIGHPGRSSTQTMINAAQALIDTGVADPDKIGLQGHSWAGYQSAFMITQTDMFKAVVSGAPVSNMTSAFSGIRLESGIARQFQYETGQSRIGKPLTEAPELYIENSPVFYADKVNTPILIMFGDNDGAVPWQEGIQYYLALRRHDKDAIFLQYEGEPHHLKKLPNQLDYSIRMKEYFDYHLKGLPPAEWIQSGEAFITEE